MKDAFGLQAEGIFFNYSAIVQTILQPNLKTKNYAK